MTPLVEAEVEARIRCICFKTGPPRTTGVELEWLVHDADDPRTPVSDDRLDAVYAAVRKIPLDSALTVEPGGQLELSSLPASSLSACVDSVSADLDRVREALRPHRLVLAGQGQDPFLPPRRHLRSERYNTMETFLDRSGPSGRSMMCSSASVQVCLDAGHEEPGPLGLGRRWLLAHLLGAVLVAAFANSAVQLGRPTGWRSTRQAHWTDIDPVRALAPGPGDPRAAWASFVLDTPVMCVRREEGPWDVPSGLTMREWLRTGRPRPVTQEDLDFHVSTLFPPARPRGHLELRMIDAQPGDDGWLVPLAVTSALFDDPEAAETAYRAVKPLGERTDNRPAPRNPLWRDAARDGLSDPELRAVAEACFAAARDALPRRGASPAVEQAVADFTERYVSRGRCPADDQLDEFHGRSASA